MSDLGVFEDCLILWLQLLTTDQKGKGSAFTAAAMGYDVDATKRVKRWVSTHFK
ncbi:hypothetical protein JRQ81_007427, partial [Phrynocephalus forsythii]